MRTISAPRIAVKIKKDRSGREGGKRKKKERVNDVDDDDDDDDGDGDDDDEVMK